MLCVRRRSKNSSRQTAAHDSKQLQVTWLRYSMKKTAMSPFPILKKENQLTAATSLSMVQPSQRRMKSSWTFSASGMRMALEVISEASFLQLSLSMMVDAIRRTVVRSLRTAKSNSPTLQASYMEPTFGVRTISLSRKMRQMGSHTLYTGFGIGQLFQEPILASQKAKPRSILHAWM